MEPSEWLNTKSSSLSRLAINVASLQDSCPARAVIQVVDLRELATQTPSWQAFFS